MTNILESYKKSVKKKAEGDVMGVIRTLFPDIEVETFVKTRKRNINKVKK
jgi:hypothetical protein